MDWVELVKALAVVLTPLGAGVAFVWNKVEKRFAAIETKLEACEGREETGHRRRGVLVAVTELLWQEVKRLAPRSPTLTRARKLLDEVHELEGLD